MTDVTALHYTSDHEWIAVDGDIVTIGITDFAANQLGDIVFLELPAVGSALAAATVVGEIESTKSVGELFAPVAGEVVEINDAAVEDPSLVNAEPFDGGWLVKVRVDGELTGAFLDKAAYDALVGGAE